MEEGKVMIRKKLSIDKDAIKKRFNELKKRAQIALLRKRRRISGL